MHITDSKRIWVEPTEEFVCLAGESGGTIAWGDHNGTLALAVAQGEDTPILVPIPESEREAVAKTLQRLVNELQKATAHGNLYQVTP